MLATPPPSPGPVETAILAELSPTFTARHHETAIGPLRILEGGHGTPLVLIHGRGGAATGWLPLLLPLAGRYRVLAVDLPGFGCSAAPAFPGGGFEAGVDFFTAPVEAWLDHEQIHAPLIMGHSLGGLVAVELGLRRRIAPQKLVLIGAMGVGPQMTYSSRLFFRAGPERLAQRVGPALFNGIVAPPDTAEGRRLAALDHEIYAASARRDAARAFDALYPFTGPVPHRRERLHEIDAPTLVLWGDHDEAFPAPVAIAAAAALPRGELVILPLGHSPHREAPAQVLGIVLEFLGR